MSIQGSSRMMPARNAINLGTVLNEVSWMEVTICSRLITIPATRPIASSGAAIQNVAISVCRIMWTAKSGVMALIETLDQGANQQVPSIHQHEQQNLEWRRQH